MLGVWSLLSWLAERSPGVSISFALCLSIQCAGVTVMMAGYIKGGAAAIPLVAALMAVTIGSTLIAKRFPSQASGAASSCLLAPAILGIGVVGLFGVLFIGRFFGRLSTASALTMMLAPLLCWATETPLLRDRKPWLVGTTRLTLVTIPLLVVLFAAKRVFDREMSPLLGKAPVFQVDDAAFAPSTHSHRSLQDQSTGAFQDADAYGRMAGIFHKAAAD